MMAYNTMCSHCVFREDLFKEMMSEREDVAAKRARCLAAQTAFRDALTALEALPQQLTSLTHRCAVPVPPHPYSCSRGSGPYWRWVARFPAASPEPGHRLSQGVLHSNDLARRHGLA